MAISIFCTLRSSVKPVKLGEKEGGWEGTCFPSVFPPQLLMVGFAISIQLNRIQNQNGNEKFPDRKARNDNSSSPRQLLFPKQEFTIRATPLTLECLRDHAQEIHYSDNAPGSPY